jgi:hypothetical protein
MAVLIRTTEMWLSVWPDNGSLGLPLEMRGYAEGIENTSYSVINGQGRFVRTLFKELAASVPFTQIVLRAQPEQ